MKLKIYQSDKGDCLLLTSKGGKHVLCDGGMRGSYVEHVRTDLANLSTLDVVYVSHIDQDHISGVLQLMDDAFAWKVHNFQDDGSGTVSQPAFDEPPTIKSIWHNAFHEQVDDNRGSVEDLLAVQWTAVLRK